MKEALGSALGVKRDYDYERLQEKCEHLEHRVALRLIYEWVKTDHINKAQFIGLIGWLHERERHEQDLD